VISISRLIPTDRSSVARLTVFPTVCKGARLDTPIAAIILSGLNHPRVRACLHSQPRKQWTSIRVYVSVVTRTVRKERRSATHMFQLLHQGKKRALLLPLLRRILPATTPTRHHPTSPRASRYTPRPPPRVATTTTLHRIRSRPRLMGIIPAGQCVEAPRPILTIHTGI
jgi:hypothetical protein